MNGIAVPPPEISGTRMEAVVGLSLVMISVTLVMCYYIVFRRKIMTTPPTRPATPVFGVPLLASFDEFYRPPELPLSLAVRMNQLASDGEVVEQPPLPLPHVTTSLPPNPPNPFSDPNL